MEANLLHLTQFASMAPAQFFIASVWQGLLLTVAAWLALKAAPLIGIRISPRTRFVLWMIVFILSAALPFSALFDSHAIAAGSHKASALFSAHHLPAIWAVAIVGVWAVASCISMARLLWDIYRLDTLARTSTPLPAEALSDELRALIQTSAGNKPASKRAFRPVEICLSDRIDSPVVIGFFSPAVVIPRWLWRKLTPSESNQIVLHELAHLERRDDWTNLLQKFLRALFPLNPALLFAERQLCSEREMACDDAVLDAAISPKEYATCLTSLAENKLLRRMQSLAPGAWQRHSELAQRVHRVLEHRGAARALRPLHSRAVIGAFLAVYLCAGLALTRCPRLVAFTPSARRSAAPLTLAIEAQSLSSLSALNTDGGSRFVRTDLRTEGMQGVNARVVDATFRTPASSAHASSAQVPSTRLLSTRPSPARLASKKPAAARSGVRIMSKHRLTVGQNRPSLAQVRVIESKCPSRWAQEQIAQARLAETRLILYSADAPQAVPAGLAQALFEEALMIQAAEQGAPRLAGANSTAQLILYLSPLPAAPGSHALNSPQSADSPSNSSWIVIRL